MCSTGAFPPSKSTAPQSQCLHTTKYTTWIMERTILHPYWLSCLYRSENKTYATPQCLMDVLYKVECSERVFSARLNGNQITWTMLEITACNMRIFLDLRLSRVRTYSLERSLLDIQHLTNADGWRYLQLCVHFGGACTQCSTTKMTMIMIIVSKSGPAVHWPESWCY